MTLINSFYEVWIEGNSHEQLCLLRFSSYYCLFSVFHTPCVEYIVYTNVQFHSMEKETIVDFLPVYKQSYFMFCNTFSLLFVN